MDDPGLDELLRRAARREPAALDRLEYQYHEYTTVSSDDGPQLSKLELYNAVIWCTGEEDDPLSPSDKSNLTAFLNRGDGR